MHALRDCPANKDVWKMLIYAKYWPTFFSGNIIDWIIFNSKREIGRLNNTNWKLTFGEAIWKIWLRRDAWIFRQEKCEVANLYWKIILAVKDFEESMEVLKFSNTSKREITVKWTPLVEGWVKCSVDGSNKEDGTSLGCDGVIRDAKGDWLSSFQMNLGCLDSVLSEIWGILTALDLA